MGYRKCSGCGKWYDPDRGGCTNAGCEGADRATIGRIATTPVHPLSKSPIVTAATAQALPKVALRPVTRPAPSAAAQQLGPQIAVTLKSVQSPAPVVVSDEQADEMSDEEMCQLESGYHIIYRGDTRTPSQLKGYGGFTAWVPLSTQQARDVIRRSNGENFNIKLPPKASRLEGYFNEQKNINMLTLGRQIKLEKAGDTFHISTDPTEGCGGYASGYIYAMRFRTLYLVDIKKKTATEGALKSVKGINSILVLNTMDMNTADTIAVAIPGQAGAEVAFLTSIGMDCIYKYKQPMGKIWYKMPA